jgi:hypothetical protein
VDEYKLAEKFEELLKHKINERIYDNSKAYKDGIMTEYFAGEKTGLEESLYVMLEALACIKRRRS